MLNKIQDELNTRNLELQTAEETKRKLLSEKLSLEERISRLERKKIDEVLIMIAYLWF